MPKIIVIVALLTLAATPVIGYDMPESRAIGMGRGVNLLTPTPTGLLRATSDQLKPGEWMFEAGYHRRFELADLDDLFVAGAYRRGPVTVAFGASQFGKTDLYAEQLLKGSVAYHRRGLSASVSLSGMQVQIGNDYGTLRAATAGLGFGFSHPLFLASFSIDNLTGPSLIDGGTRAPRQYSFHTHVLSSRSYSFVGRVHWESGEKPQLGLGQIVRLHPRASLFWGLATEPLEYGGGLEIVAPFGILSYATSVHPTLGLSHTVTVSFSPSRSSRDGGEDFD